MLGFNRPLSSEMALAIACCRLSFRNPVRVPVGGVVDWEQFLGLSRRHRIQGLTHAGVETLGLPVPNPIAMALKSDAQGIVEHNLRSAAESARLLRLFKDAAVPTLFLKGLTVGALAYRDPFLKMGWDIDVLVPYARVGKAGSLLTRAGYDLIEPRRRSAFKAWHKRRKESVWKHRHSGLYVELHTRLADHPALIPNVGLSAPFQLVDVAPQVALPALRIEEQFAYLSVHGASSAWFRLKWAADLAGLLSDRSADEVGRLYRRSQELGSGRAAGQALLLINQLFDTPLADDLRTELLASRPTRWLRDAAMRQLSADREPTERLLGTATIHWTQLLLSPGLRFALSEGSRQIKDAVS